MFEHDYLAGQPLFYLFIAFSALLSFGYFWGKRYNEKLYRTSFQDLVDIVKPVDQTFTNIGGIIGFHARLTPPKRSPFERIDATITFLPRHSWLWMPISKIVRKYDRLFVTIHLRRNPIGEGHLIETGYARFRGPKISNESMLQREEIAWGTKKFLLYYGGEAMRGHLHRYVEGHGDPGQVRHIALVPEQRKCFIFLIPRKNRVARSFDPVYRWLPSVLKPEEDSSTGKRKDR
ncbi:MAG: hypothetical protein HPY65_18580 [Syntrophaceae bacterium]|nr:hypothetical protein [Syntrophaceae bacterium]